MDEGHLTAPLQVSAVSFPTTESRVPQSWKSVHQVQICNTQETPLMRNMEASDVGGELCRSVSVVQVDKQTTPALSSRRHRSPPPSSASRRIIPSDDRKPENVHREALAVRRVCGDVPQPDRATNLSGAWLEFPSETSFIRSAFLRPLPASSPADCDKSVLLLLESRLETSCDGTKMAGQQGSFEPQKRGMVRRPNVGMDAALLSLAGGCAAVMSVWQPVYRTIHGVASGGTIGHAATKGMIVRFWFATVSVPLLKNMDSVDEA